jgi:alpha-tubulin suppressor-like RCC1 family protein
MDGVLGNGTSSGPERCEGEAYGCSDVPVAVSGISSATAVSTSGFSACALLSGGSVDCWGSNSNGELGDGTDEGPEKCTEGGSVSCSTTPVAASVVTSPAIAVISGSTPCVLHASGTVECWGDAGTGELGNGTIGGVALTPVAVSGISNAQSLAAGAGANHTLTPCLLRRRSISKRAVVCSARPIVAATRRR